MRTIYQAAMIYLLLGLVAGQALPVLAAHGLSQPWLVRAASSCFEAVFVTLFGIW